MKAAATKLLDNDKRGPTSGSADAGAAATRVLDDGARAPPGGSAKAGAAATKVLDYGERAPPGGSAKAGAGRLDDGESSAISRELVAKRRCEANRYSGEQRGQLGVGSRDETLEGWKGYRGVMTRPPLSCVQSATSGTMPAPASR